MVTSSPIRFSLIDGDDLMSDNLQIAREFVEWRMDPAHNRELEADYAAGLMIQFGGNHKFPIKEFQDDFQFRDSEIHWIREVGDKVLAEGSGLEIVSGLRYRVNWEIRVKDGKLIEIIETGTQLAPEQAFTDPLQGENA